MTERPIRARARIALYAVVTLCTVFAGFALLAHILVPRCLFAGVVKREVPVPPASAGPREVVNAYIEAMLGKDEKAVRALSVPETDFDNLILPFQDWISASGLSIDEPYATTDCPAGEKCQRMMVTMDLCAVNEGSHPDGHFATGFQVRYVNDRWLVTGFGSG
ncbi:hypothetical protein Aph01nite_50890 [Acrocarpospora phusangensis]|uniref:Uncharacterized protein n=1 Tax=Acrocarpospora phusangensis TaxID=1070424 RepID=A0A919UMA4_9ACTN|nr:hypothetical protein [Acrocarpospora phusangensis]GIH26779.1 hypothetical protein Aph01nite_50890 [Acrocarpospora phusangensis]